MGKENELFVIENFDLFLHNVKKDIIKINEDNDYTRITH
jgi:hypothetical protein